MSEPKTATGEELHVGQVGSTGLIFIGCTKGYYERCRRPISRSVMHTISVTEDEARWLIKALRKELRRAALSPDSR
jgi:hypothetical protein